MKLQDWRRHPQPPKASCPSSPVDQVGRLHSDTRSSWSFVHNLPYVPENWQSKEKWPIENWKHMKNNHPRHPRHPLALTTNKQAKSEWIGLPPAFPLPHCAKAQMTCNEGLGRYIKTSLLWMAPGLLTHLTLTRWNKSQKWAASQRKADRTQGRGLSRNWSNFWAPPTFFASWHFVDVS